MRHYRKEKVASAIHEIIGNALIHGLNDPRIDPLTTVTRVEVTADLLIARVYISVPGDEAVERLSLTGLRHAGGHLRRILARELDLRLCPEIRFDVDETAKKVRETMRLLDENRQKNPNLFPEAETEEAGDGAPADDDFDVDDEDDDHANPSPS
jgi:ribosome-binding factor A